MSHSIAIPYVTKHDIVAATEDQIAHWMSLSGLPSYCCTWFSLARDEALKSTHHISKIGCVLVYKNHVIGKGYNRPKTAPIQRTYNHKYRAWTRSDEFELVSGHQVHAEIDALRRVPYPIAQQVNWSRVKVYVYRVAPGLAGYTGLALPCLGCAAALSEAGIRHVYYTTGHLDQPFGHCDI